MAPALFCLVCQLVRVVCGGVGWWILSVLHRWRMVIAQTAVKRAWDLPTGEAGRRLLGVIYLQYRLNEIARHLQMDEREWSNTA